MTNREKLRAILSDRSPNGEKNMIEFMNDNFGCPLSSGIYIDCDEFNCCEFCWKHYLESEVNK